MTKRLAVGYLIALAMMAVFVFAQGAPTLYLNGISPQSAPQGSPAFTLVLTASQFSGCLPVVATFNGTPLTTTPMDSVTINATVPASAVAAAGTYPVRLTSGICMPSNTMYFTVTPPPLAFATASPLPRAVAGRAYSATIAATGGTPPYEWDYSNAGFPGGLTFSGGVTPSATISGTPATAGTYTFTVYLGDHAGSAAPLSRNYVLTVDPPLQIITTAVANGTLGKAYVQAFSVVNGAPPITWSLYDSSLPPGLTLNPSTGTVSGTPTQTGTFQFALRASDSSGQWAVQDYTMTIVTAPLDIPVDSLAPGKVGAAYSAQIPTTGGNAPIKFRIDSGLPPGLVLDPGTGIISGTPTQVGTFSMAVYAQDVTGFVVAKAVTLLVTAGGEAVQITTAALPGGSVGAGYTAQFVAIKGVPPYTWSGCTNIPGLTLSQAGVLSGTPTTAGDYTCNAVVHDSQGGSAETTLPLRIVTGLAISLPAALSSATVGTAYQQDFVAAGGHTPFLWSATGLPGGLTLSDAGVLSGTPTVAGVFNVVVHVTDSVQQQAEKTYTLTVFGQLAITTGTVAAGFVGIPYSQALTVDGGEPPYTWSAPPGGGLAVTEDGKITGTPSTVGPVRLTITVTDSARRTVTKVLTVNVGAGVAFATETLPNGTVGTSYSQTLQTTGGQAPLNFDLHAGTLPPGLTLSTDGTLSGQPTTQGSFTFTLQVTDAHQVNATQTYTVAIGLPTTPALTVTSSSTQPGPNQQSNIGVTVGSPFPTTLTGRLVLTFAPDTVNGGDDASIQFASGGRVAGFTIPAGSTQVNFSVPAQAIQLGSTAGTITITLDQLRANGADITPLPTPVTTIRINRAGPTITSVTAVRRANGFDVTVSGFSPSREVTQAVFHFTAAAGQTLSKTDDTESVSGAFAAWYNSAQSAQFGSLFTMVMPFNTDGPSTAIASVSVTLVNSAGSSQTVSANLQ